MLLATSGWSIVVGTTYLWELDNIEVGGVIGLMVETILNNLLSLGINISLTAKVDSLSLEFTTSNNTKTIGSIDSNDILVDPSFFFFRKTSSPIKIWF